MMKSKRGRWVQQEPPNVTLISEASHSSLSTGCPDLVSRLFMNTNQHSLQMQSNYFESVIM